MDHNVDQLHQSYSLYLSLVVPHICRGTEEEPRPPEPRGSRDVRAKCRLVQPSAARLVF